MRPVRALVVPLLVLLAWQLAASLGLASPYLLPAPATVLHTAGDMLESGLLVRHRRPHWDGWPEVFPSASRRAAPWPRC